jgi:hypothetical protein
MTGRTGLKRSWLLLAFAICSLGCNGGRDDKWLQARAKTVPVSGVVTLDGKPVEAATVVFFATSADLAATGSTDAEGRFVLRTYEPSDGAVLGQHEVMIEKTTETQVMPQDPEAPIPPPKIEHHLPRRYGDHKKSGLTAVVEEPGPNVFEFTLKAGS